MKRWKWPTVIYALATLALTWPLLLHFTESIPMGSDRWLRMDVPLPPGAQGQYLVMLINNVGGEVLAEREVDIPGG
jgi:hypothetical protein